MADTRPVQLPGETGPDAPGPVRSSPGRTALEASPRSGPGHVWVARGKTLVKHCPAIGTDEHLAVPPLRRPPSVFADAARSVRCGAPDGSPHRGQSRECG
ncbi:hypothetical protein [Actinomadura decatromicini]|uniref:Uncharacterized protein n=1 Tax=Actinomadura decatromicini TaxID=2604572 RepID=A0A5D3FSN4_9ACTN|nr:hypothetical protein [Actinomadura decatromicini]TYK51068.1 hypothetical protein FXF68_11500 [Actinomadura decatromicini]